MIQSSIDRPKIDRSITISRDVSVHEGGVYDLFVGRADIRLQHVLTVITNDEKDDKIISESEVPSRSESEDLPSSS